MKGVVFNLLEAVVCQYHGEDVWDDQLESAGVSGSYASRGNFCKPTTLFNTLSNRYFVSTSHGR